MTDQIDQNLRDIAGMNTPEIHFAEGAAKNLNAMGTAFMTACVEIHSVLRATEYANQVDEILARHGITLTFMVKQ